MLSRRMPIIIATATSLTLETTLAHSRRVMRLRFYRGEKQRCHAVPHKQQEIGAAALSRSHDVFSGKLSVPLRTRSFSANVVVSIK
jgi:hypothetical protein